VFNVKSTITSFLDASSLPVGAKQKKHLHTIQKLLKFYSIAVHMESSSIWAVSPSWPGRKLGWGNVWGNL